MPSPALAFNVKGSAVTRLDPWKEDGNIVITVQGEKPYFRVHRSILSTYSDVFKDMFDCPLFQTEEETVDLCPVVHLHDPVEDVQIMLKAMYDRSYPTSCFDKMTISMVTTFLRMGDKYSIPSLTKEAKSKLGCALGRTSWKTPLPRRMDLFPAITDGDPHDFQIMNLLQEMDLKAFLPLAMYQCVISCSLEKIVDGYRFDGLICSLSLANLRSFIRMKDILENHRVSLAENLKFTCCSRAGCAHSILQLWSEDMASLSVWKSEWDNLFCGSCTKDLKTKRDAVITKTWNKLPTAFGFDSWEKVRKSGEFPSLAIRAC